MFLFGVSFQILDAEKNLHVFIAYKQHQSCFGMINNIKLLVCITDNLHHFYTN